MAQASTSSLCAWFARVDAAQYRLCRRPNHTAAFPVPRRILQAASRVGDGLVRYLLIMLPRCLRLLIPLALTIAASRVILGLHYPTYVLAGAVLGALLGAPGLSLS